MTKPLDHPELDALIVETQTARDNAESSAINAQCGAAAPYFWRAKVALMSGSPKAAAKNYGAGIAILEAALTPIGNEAAR